MYITIRSFALAVVLALFTIPVHAEIHSYLEGHADLGLGDGDALELHFHAHKGTVVDGIAVTDPDGLELAPTEVAIVVPESTKNYARTTLGGANADIAAHLGIGTGNDYWFLPETNSGPGGAATLHSPFFGLGAEDVNPGVFDNDLLNLTLLSMAGPTGGQFALGTYETGWLMSTADGISSTTDKIDDIPVGEHAHLGWYFSQPGTYQLTFQTSAMVGGSLVTDENTYTFQVVPEPSTLFLLTSTFGFALIYALSGNKIRLGRR